MSSIKLVAVDLDGTLLTDEGILAPRGVARLRQAVQGGVHVVIATMRALDTALPFYHALELNAPLICMNGALIWGGLDGSIWACHRIPQDVALAIAQYADAHDLKLSITIDTMTYFRQRPGQAPGLIAPYRTVVPSNADAVTAAPARMMIWGADAIEPLRAFCVSNFPDRCRLDIHYTLNGTAHSMGIFAPHVNKGTALAFVGDRLGVEMTHVMAIGDNTSDLPMFAHAGFSVAMENGLDDVKKQASVVAPSNDDEGVAWAVEKFVLREDDKRRDRF